MIVTDGTPNARVWPGTRFEMLRGAVFVLTVFAAFYANPWFRAMGAQQDAQKQQSKDRAAPATKEATVSLTGCVDEQEGNYVLLSDRTMSPIANLEADGFPKEGFAKHVGHKVTVRGISNAQGTLPLIKVRTIETVSESCTPQPRQEGPGQRLQRP